MQVAGIDLPDPYLWGLVGSGGVELAAFVHAASLGEIPKKYRSFAFLIARFIFVFVAAALVLAHNVTSALLAIHVGASAPVIFSALAEKPPAGTQATR